MTPTIVRVSGSASFTDCERRGAARMFRDELAEAGFTLRRLPHGVAAVIGTSVHRSAAAMLGEKATRGELPPVSFALDVGRDALADQLSAGEITFDGPRGTAFNSRDATAQVVAMVRMYHLKVAPAVEPIVVERRLEAEIEPGLVLSGQSDLVAREPHGLRDLKTGAMPPRDYSVQLGGYALLIRSHKLDVDTAAIDFIQRVSPKKPQPLPVSKRVPIARAETAAANVIRRIATCLDTFRHGDAERRILPGDPWSFTANPASRLCSPKYCPAYGTDFCHEGDPDRETEK